MNQRGISVLELVIALTIGTVVLLAAGAFYRSVVFTSKSDFSEADLQNQATIIAAEIQRQVEAATTIAACYPGSDCLVDTCDGRDGQTEDTKFLYVAQADGSIYCFYKNGNQLIEYCQPVGAGPHSCMGNMLAGAGAKLIVTSFDICGSPPYATCQAASDIAYVTFQLRATGLLGGASAEPTVTFSVAAAKRT
jgi:Tfp pilus assembly protein PilE